MASRLAQLEGPIDTVYADIYNESGLRKETTLSKELGFKGKLIVHPAQIKIVNEVFTPSKSEVEQARKIIDAAHKAEKQGKGVVNLDGKMIDLPVIKQAEAILEYYNRLVINNQ
ncbi:HpcH/HpaI aldolase/citrate lyase family protein [Ureibacillus sp. Re31]|uniref:HpcH/HpaI aldolase/citrate lyase family protein n=1 Tax=Ureibacillus galli TaxID=2762222 RepID=A0ABR8X7P2_9BACL|nr:HpcH/HpaI aldolase/citrate lyase family protein [Ureibacillus galli]MBD8025334.1 HpcH/HpaI aldolase/citrate lyase family protein [Ureibacillus galli]